ncbi:scavenger receptor class F member 2, partial [Egretta garzetta]|uniref:scavenger receptor class F member 2 n=1 Tax=Egretta garzetta TaxID=188379 RepID=UPI00163D2F2A
ARPGGCRCRHGYFGANCDTKCPRQFWGPDCKEMCSCHPNGQCEDVTGQCTCNPNRWGPKCENVCLCKHGKCDQKTGKCTCEPNWWGPQCSSSCYCTVPAGRCLTCEAGWNGTKCDQPCSPGFYGEGCEKLCPPCKDGHTCNHINGKCSHCNPGWIGDRCETKCRNGTYGENCAFVCSDCVNGQCHFETGQCLCHPGSHGTYCNLTCPPGRYGANCAEACSCHDGACDPLTGACHMEANQRMGVIGAGALLALLLILLLSLLCCCCVCRKKDEAHGQDPAAAKKPPRRLCGRFSRIGMKLPRIPLRRQKLPKVVVAHHDLENTLNCSFIEPPSVVEQPSPSWSSRGSFSSFDTMDEGPVYCVPHEGMQVLTLPPVRLQSSLCQHSPLLVLGSLTGRRGRGTWGHTRQSKEEEDAVTEPRSPGKPPSPERTKPRPPDPATKPKVSWIHGRDNSSQSNSLPVPSRSPERAAAQSGSPEQGQGLAKRKRSPSETSAGVQGRAEEKGGARGKEKAQKQPKEPGVPEGKASLAGEPQSPSKPKQRSKAGSEPTESINGAVQNAFRKMGAFQPERRVGDNRDAPRSPGASKSRPEPLHPQLASELAAQLKEKTQSLNKGDGGTRVNGVGAQREKPTPPQKAKRSVATGSQKTSKPLLPTSPHLQKLIPGAAEPAAGEPKRVEKPSDVLGIAWSGTGAEPGPERDAVWGWVTLRQVLLEKMKDDSRNYSWDVVNQLSVTKAKTDKTQRKMGTLSP